LRGRQFLAYVQNHDQIGNRAIGDRLAANLGPDKLKLAAALHLLSPFVPMLFMGEEWGSRRPFQYFTDHTEPELADAVREGRRREFAAFDCKPEDVPDPQAESTFQASKLDWREATEPCHQALRDWYTALLSLRRELPGLEDDRLEASQVTWDEDAGWLRLRRGALLVVCNFAAEPREVPLGVDGPVSLRLAS